MMQCVRTERKSCPSYAPRKAFWRNSSQLFRLIVDYSDHTDDNNVEIDQ